MASALVDGWALRDTEHSIVLYHGPEARRCSGRSPDELVAVRKRFAADFRPIGPPVR